MTKYFGLFVGGVTALGVALIIIMSCGKPNPPLPPFDSDFVIEGALVKIEGKLKSGATVSMDEVKRSLKVAADLIDSK